MPYHIINIILTTAGFTFTSKLNFKRYSNKFLPEFFNAWFLASREYVQDSDKDSDEQYHIETTCQIYFLWMLSQENTWISNLENLDLDLIQSILLKCGYLRVMIGFWISPKNHKICFGIQESVFRFSQKNAPLVWHFSIWINFNLVRGYELKVTLEKRQVGIFAIKKWNDRRKKNIAN